jgi:hypothetical protein
MFLISQGPRRVSVCSVPVARCLSIVWCLFIFAVLFPRSAVGQRATLTDDTQVSANNPNQNFGSKTSVQISGTSLRGFLKFKLTPNLPNGTTGGQIEKATLKLYLSAVNTPGSLELYRIAGTWDEVVITNNTAPATASLLGTVFIDVTQQDRWITVDVTSVVKDWLDGVQVNNGIALVAAPSGVNVVFNSKENQATSHEPLLEILLNHVATAAQATNADNANSAATADALSSSAIVNGSQVNGALTNATIGASSITGIVTIANGGTGSSTQSFVDLSNDQNISGNKSFSGNVGIGTAIPAFNLDVVGQGNFSGTLRAGSHLNVAGNLFIQNSFPQVNLDNGTGQNLATFNATTGPGSTAAIGSVPGTSFVIRSGGIDSIFIDPNNQRVGIGTTSPQKRLDVASGVNEGIQVTGTDGTELRIVNHRAVDLNSPSRVVLQDNISAKQWSIENINNGQDFRIFEFPELVTPFFIQRTTGNVGIGISAPTEKLEVAGNVRINGDFVATGTKSAVVTLADKREVTLYAIESPGNWFEDFGSAKLTKGIASVQLDALFVQTVNTGFTYHVFLTPNGNCNGLYVASKTAGGFEVRELGGGKSNTIFDYRIVARRKGYENVTSQRR